MGITSLEKLTCVVIRLPGLMTTVVVLVQPMPASTAPVTISKEIMICFLYMILILEKNGYTPWLLLEMQRQPGLDGMRRIGLVENRDPEIHIGQGREINVLQHGDIRRLQGPFQFQRPSRTRIFCLEPDIRTAGLVLLQHNTRYGLG